MTVRDINPLLYALWCSSYGSWRIIDLLPKTDLTCEILEILMEQSEIIDGVISGDIFDLRDIDEYIDKCHKMIKQAERIESKKK